MDLPETATHIRQRYAALAIGNRFIWPCGSKTTASFGAIDMATPGRSPELTAMISWIEAPALGMNFGSPSQCTPVRPAHTGFRYYGADAQKRLFII